MADLISRQAEHTNEHTETHACDSISRQAAIDAFAKAAREKFSLSDEFGHYLDGLEDADKAVRALPSAQPEQRWNRLMMYLADLQLTYSPGWGANGQGDEKIYEFVTGLIDELQGWEEEAT